MTIWSGSGPCRLWWRLCSGSSRSQRCVWCGDGERSMQRHCEQSRQCVFPLHSSVDPSPSSSRTRCHNETSFRVYTKQTRLLQRSVGWSAKSTTVPFQRAQNAVVRLVTGIVSRDHATPALRQLHWLPQQYRISFKVGLCLLMHKIRTKWTSYW